MRIIFVCTGNTCRSPMAEALAKEAFSQKKMDVEVASRGVSICCPAGAAVNAQQAMEEMGLSLKEHISKPLSIEDVKEADFVLTMTDSHKKLLQSLCGETDAEILTLGEAAGQKGVEIMDPFGQNIDCYRQCAAQLKELVEKLPEFLLKKK